MRRARCRILRHPHRIILGHRNNVSHRPPLTNQTQPRAWLTMASKNVFAGQFTNDRDIESLAECFGAL
jgi:hypothetical protein